MAGSDGLSGSYAESCVFDAAFGFEVIFGVVHFACFDCAVRFVADEAFVVVVLFVIEVYAT